MLDSKNSKMCVEVVNKFGHGIQMIKAVEEMAELTQAICKAFGSKSKVDMENAREELADVAVVLAELQFIFGMTDKELNDRAEIKLEKALQK